MNTTDSSEVEKFERLAERWWDTEGEWRVLHQMNPLRANYIDERSPVAGRRVLDIGCGGGLLCEALEARGAEVTGIDVGERTLRVAELHRDKSECQVEYRLIEAQALAAERPGHYDIVCCMELLEHVPEPAALVESAAALAKPGGSLYFSTINRNPRSWLLAIVGAEYILGLLPRGTHNYEKLIRPRELGAWLRRAQLQLKEISGLFYNPLTGSFRLIRDPSVNYMVHACKGRHRGN